MQAYLEAMRVRVSMFVATLAAAMLVACATDRVRDTSSAPSSASAPPRSVSVIVAIDSGSTSARSAPSTPVPTDAAATPQVDANGDVTCTGPAFDAYEQRISRARTELEKARTSKKADRITAAVKAAIDALQSPERRAWSASSPAAEAFFSTDASRALVELQAGRTDEATRTLGRYIALLEACEFGMLGLIQPRPNP